MPVGVENLLNYGVLGIVLLVLVVGIWRAATFAGKKLFGNGDKQGYADQLISAAKNLFDGIAERDERQMGLCEQHAKNLEDIATVMRQHISRADQAAKLAEHRNSDMRDFSQAVADGAVEWCRLCKHLAAHHLPETSSAVDMHCDAIERIFFKQQPTHEDNVAHGDKPSS